MSLRFVPALPVLSQVWGHEQRLQDWLHRTGRRTSTHPEFVFVAISTKSLAGPESAKAGKDRMLQLMAQHPFPWSREVWARLLDRLFESGAQLVIFDMLFSGPNEGDFEQRGATPFFQCINSRYDATGNVHHCDGFATRGGFVPVLFSTRQ